MIPSIRVFIAGNSGTGKSTRAWWLYLSKMPRCLLLDQTGEYESQADLMVDNVRDAVEGIRAYAQRGHWTITLALDPDELPTLVDWLIPVPYINRSPVRAMGGLALLVDEVDLVAPMGPPPTHIRTLYRRSRHAGLTVISCTQRPENVSREVSAQSNHALALHCSEPRSHDYLRGLFRWDQGQLTSWLRWTQQHPHGGCWKNLRTGDVLWLSESGAPSRRGPTTQLDVFSSGPDSPASLAPASDRGAAGVLRPTGSEISGDGQGDGQENDAAIQEREQRARARLSVFR